MTSQAFSPKLFNNSGINIGLRWLFAIYVISFCDNWMENLALYTNSYLKQQTENNKTQIMDAEWLKTVTSCSKFCINISHLNQSETLITVMSELFFCEGFSTGHIIITTIIILLQHIQVTWCLIYIIVQQKSKKYTLSISVSCTN